MDTRKIYKPVHLRCEKCGYDITYNAGQVTREIEVLGNEILSINKQLASFKAQHTKKECQESQWYKNAIKALNIKKGQMAELKQVRKHGDMEVKLQSLQEFVNRCKEEFGRERVIELLQECENDMVYHDYETAIQRYTDFDISG